MIHTLSLLTLISALAVAVVAVFSGHEARSLVPVRVRKRN